MNTITNTPRIYVASLSDYNAGILRGKWIDANQDAEDIHTEIEDMLSESKQDLAEEWAIHDSDGFDGITISESEDIEKVAQLGQAIKEHGLAFALYADMVGSHYATVEGFEEQYQGAYKDEEDYAYELVDSLGYLQDASDFLASYFDYEKFARDLFMGDYWGDRDNDGNFHVFLRN